MESIIESIIEFIIQFIVAGFATFSFAVLFSAPKKELLYCGFSGAFGWILYYILVQLGMGVVVPSRIVNKQIKVFPCEYSPSYQIKL